MRQKAARALWWSAAGFAFISFVCALTFSANAQARTTPVSIQELDTTLTRNPRNVLQTELDLENRTQGVPGTFGPFAVEQQQRETFWLHYESRSMFRVSVGCALIQRFEIAQVGARSSSESRYYVRTRLTQPAEWGKHYEEFWVQLRVFADSSGAPLTFPVVRLRYGQQFRLGAMHSIETYEEVAFKFAPASYSAARFDHVRLNAMYSLPIASGMSLQAGVRFQDAVRPSGGTYNLSYGPVFVVNYRP